MNPCEDAASAIVIENSSIDGVDAGALLAALVAAAKAKAKAAAVMRRPANSNEVLRCVKCRYAVNGCVVCKNYFADGNLVGPARRDSLNR